MLYALLRYEKIYYKQVYYIGEIIEATLAGFTRCYTLLHIGSFPRVRVFIITRNNNIYTSEQNLDNNTRELANSRGSIRSTRGKNLLSFCGLKSMFKVLSRTRGVPTQHTLDNYDGEILLSTRERVCIVHVIPVFARDNIFLLIMRYPSALGSFIFNYCRTICTRLLMALMHFCV